MQEIIQQFLNNEYRSSLIAIDSYDDKTLQGRLYSSTLREEWPFANVMQLLLLIEKMLNEMDYPQPFTETRQFWKGAVSSFSFEEYSAEALPQAGKLANFRLKIVFRQNASWQGSLCWLDQGQEESFRSVLEFLFLLDNALSK